MFCENIILSDVNCLKGVTFVEEILYYESLDSTGRHHNNTIMSQSTN